MNEKNVSTEKTTLKNANVLKIVNELSESSLLISRSAKSKLTGAFDADISVLEEGPLSFKGKVTGFADRKSVV